MSKRNSSFLTIWKSYVELYNAAYRTTDDRWSMGILVKECVNTPNFTLEHTVGPLLQKDGRGSPFHLRIGGTNGSSSN